jgi:hypothetical protein
LRELYLVGNGFTDDGVPEIGRLRGLEVVGLYYTAITNAGTRRLKDILRVRTPGCADFGGVLQVVRH